MDLKEALRIKLNDRLPVSFKDDNEMIVKKVTYNKALKDISIFIKDFEAGDIGKDYLLQLDKIQKGK